jgi:hypothetical protein
VQWGSSRQDLPEAELLDELGQKFSSFAFTVTSTKRFYSLSKSGFKLVCNVNIVYGNLKSENSQDYAQNLNEIVRS